MEIVRIGALVTAFIRSVEGVNAAMIHTPEGLVMLDTTSSPAEARALLEAVDVAPEEVRLVINTHFHTDHTWGNQIFSCPILAQRLCLERMQKNLKNEWSEEKLWAFISELEKTNPTKAEEMRKVVQELRITLPSRIFDARLAEQLGGMSYQVIHLGGHTPDLSVVWLPESRVLFASDLIFQGRYPYIFDADIPAWIGRLGELMKFEASAIVPGHGGMCGEAEINILRDYLQGTWELSAEHVRLGNSEDQAAQDPRYPRFPGEKYEKLHEANIRYMYQKQSGS